MKVYSVNLTNPDGLDVTYGMFTKHKANGYAKQKMREIEAVYATEKDKVNLDNLNITISGYTINGKDEFSVASWILRDDGYFTEETDEDRLNWLENEANKLGFTIQEE